MARAIMAGVSLGIFEALEEKPDSADGLARRLRLDPRGADILLVALHSMGYVEERSGTYRNASAVEKFLLADSSQTVRAYVGDFNRDMWDEFSRIEGAVRTGETSGLHERPPDDPYWERYMRGLFDLTRLAGDDVARMIPARNPKRMLDLAGGHGGYAIAMCRRHADLTVTIADDLIHATPPNTRMRFERSDDVATVRRRILDDDYAPLAIEVPTGTRATLAAGRSSALVLYVNGVAVGGGHVLLVVVVAYDSSHDTVVGADRAFAPILDSLRPPSDVGP